MGLRRLSRHFYVEQVFPHKTQPPPILITDSVQKESRGMQRNLFGNTPKTQKSALLRALQFALLAKIYGHDRLAERPLAIFTARVVCPFKNCHDPDGIVRRPIIFI